MAPSISSGTPLLAYDPHGFSPNLSWAVAEMGRVGDEKALKCHQELADTTSVTRASKVSEECRVLT